MTLPCNFFVSDKYARDNVNIMSICAYVNIRFIQGTIKKFSGYMLHTNFYAIFMI